MVSSFLASAPPREVIEAVAASVDLSGSIRMECGYVGAANQRKCGADPTRDVDPRVVDVEEVQGQDDNSDEEPQILQVDSGLDPPPNDGAAQMEVAESDGVFQHIFNNIVHDDDEQPAYLDPLFERGLEANSPGSGDETQEHDHCPIAIPEPSQIDDLQRNQYNDEDVGESNFLEETSDAAERPCSPPRHYHPQSRQQDTGMDSPQQDSADIEEHGHRLAALAAALGDLSLSVARSEPVNVDRLAEGMASDLTIGLISDREQGTGERLEHLTVQTRGSAVQEPRASAQLLGALTHAEELATLVRLYPITNTSTQPRRPASHRRSMSDTIQSLHRNFPHLQVRGIC